MTLGQAQWEGKADVIDLPGGTKVVTNDAAPVALQRGRRGAELHGHRLDGTPRAGAWTYGPLTGEVVVEPGAGDVPSVSRRRQAGRADADSGPREEPRPPQQEAVVTPAPGPGGARRRPV